MVVGYSPQKGRTASTGSSQHATPSVEVFNLKEKGLQHNLAFSDHARKVTDERTTILGFLVGNPRFDSPFVDILEGQSAP